MLDNRYAMFSMADAEAYFAENKGSSKKKNKSSATNTTTEKGNVRGSGVETYERGGIKRVRKARLRPSIQLRRLENTLGRAGRATWGATKTAAGWTGDRASSAGRAAWGATKTAAGWTGDRASSAGRAAWGATKATGGWVKTNPGKSAAIVGGLGAAGAAGYYLSRRNDR
jgi:hypothetical protein